MAAQTTQIVPLGKTEIVARFEFTTLEGLFQALIQLPHDDEVRRGEIYPEDRNGNPIGCLQLRRTTLTDGSKVLDAILSSSGR